MGVEARPLGGGASRIPSEPAAWSGRGEVLEGLRCGRNSFWVTGEGEAHHRGSVVWNTGALVGDHRRATTEVGGGLA
jgi:hypothetical protein